MTAEPFWKPFPNSPQEMAYHSLADELFFGGGAGGGKSDLLLGLAGTAHRSSLILRREFPQTRGLIERSREIYNRAGESHARDSYNESLHLWRLADNRIIEFGSVQHDKDKRKFQGRPHDLKAWDELPQFQEQVYRFINAWNRSTYPNQRCRVVATGNPPVMAEEEWVIHYWAPWLDDQHSNPAKPGELRWFGTVDGKDVEFENNKELYWKGEVIKPRSRSFIPALLTDNPVLLATGYKSVIDATPEPLRSALMGNWRAARQDDLWQVIPTEWIRQSMQRWRERGKPDMERATGAGMDVARGGSDKTVVAKVFGQWFAPPVSVAGSQTPNGPTAAALYANDPECGGVRVHIDVIGIGSSAYDSLAGAGVDVVPVNFGEGSKERTLNNKMGFRNKRAEYYWRMREALDPDFGAGLMLPDDAELLSDLAAPRWQLSTSGIQIESKDDIRERIGRSPDKGDAVVLARAAAHSGGIFL